MLWSTCVGHLNRNDGWTWLNLVIGFPQPQRLFRSTSLWSRFWLFQKGNIVTRVFFLRGHYSRSFWLRIQKNAVIRLCRPGEVRWRYIQLDDYHNRGVRDSERPRMWQLSIVSTIKYIPSLALPMSFFVRIKGCVNGLEGFRQMIGMVALLLFANS
jgi:hypothetical protein